MSTALRLAVLLRDLCEASVTSVLKPCLGRSLNPDRSHFVVPLCAARVSLDI
jgi:hypothetical protein